MWHVWNICRREVPYGVLVGKPEGQRTDGTPTLNDNKLKWNVSRIQVCGLDECGSGQGQVAGCCEDRPSGSVNFREHFD